MRIEESPDPIFQTGFKVLFWVYKNWKVLYLEAKEKSKIKLIKPCGDLSRTQLWSRYNMLDSASENTFPIQGAACGFSTDSTPVLARLQGQKAL